MRVNLNVIVIFVDPFGCQVRVVPLDELLRLLFTNERVCFQCPVDHVPGARAYMRERVVAKQDHHCSRSRTLTSHFRISSVVSAKRTNCARWMAVVLYRPVSFVECIIRAYWSWDLDANCSNA